jgi:hypothetical protein
MPNLTFYIDLLRRTAVRSPGSSAPAPIPDFRSPALYGVSLYFMRPANVATEGYNYVRYATGVPGLKLRRVKAPDYSTFTLDFLGYTSPVIDARLPNDSIAALIGGMASVGLGNVIVTGDHTVGFTVEFVGAQAGYAQPSFTGMVISPVGGEIVIKQVAAGGGGVNGVQTIQLREAPLAIATAWAETGVPDTPGWSATLDTTSVPQDVFDQGDLTLEAGLDAANVRTGTDGVTVYESSDKSGTDGQVAAGQTDAGVSVNLVLDATNNNRALLVARDGTTVYGRLFTKSDIGRLVTETAVGGPAPLIPANTAITDVIIQDYYNAAVLSNSFAVVPPATPVQVDLAGAPTKIFRSATAAFVFADIGHPISGDNIPDGTVIEQWTDAQTVVLSQAGTAVGTGLTWNLTALPDSIFQSATALFTLGDVGARLESPALPAGVYITGFIDANNVKVSARAVTVGTGESWTLKPNAGGFGPPSVVSSQTGTLSSHEKQLITFNQQPIGGYMTIRDGGGGLMPVVQVPAPLTAIGIAAAINTVYVNWRGVTVTELVSDGQYEIEFGVNGLQHLLVVDVSQAIFDTILAQIPAGQQSAPAAPVVAPAAFTHSLAKRTVGGLILMGVPPTGIYKIQISDSQVTQMADGSNGYMLRARYATPVSDYQIGRVGEFNGAYHLERHDNIEDRGEIRMYDWVGYSKPPNRSEYMQQSKPVMGTATSSLNGRIIDVQLVSYSFSTYIRADYKYMTGSPGSDLPGDGPWAIVIHFVAVGGFTGQSLLEWSYGNGSGIQSFWVPGGGSSFAGTGGRDFRQSWSRRRWHADFFEQVTLIG